VDQHACWRHAVSAALAGVWHRSSSAQCVYVLYICIVVEQRCGDTWSACMPVCCTLVFYLIGAAYTACSLCVPFVLTGLGPLLWLSAQQWFL
jgi:hypothetical protein